MSTRIRVLDDITANRIAAGEVVERPAAVVKELVENALDAGATRIEIEAADGGKTLLRVTDDGSGMGRDDALLCLERHATSKIRSADDLAAVATMGFRGEALPSIASVSKFRLVTREREALAGTEVVVDGGKVRAVRDAGCAPGTMVEVRALFHHTPGRRKFLRSDATEWAHIEQCVRWAALARPDVAFLLRHQGQVVLDCPAAPDAAARVRQIFGAEWLRDMLPVDAEESGGLKLSGWVGKPGVSRSSRTEHHVFVNGRPVQSAAVNFAVLEGYAGALVRGRYPVLFLRLEVPPAMVDVNVHPAKREVRFRNEAAVKAFVASAVREVVHRLRAEPAAVALEQGWQGRAPAEAASARAAGPAPRPAESTPAARQAAFIAGAPLELPEPRRPEEEAAATEKAPPEKRHDLVVKGTLLGRYILAENREGIVLVDQQAARERILFEDILDRLAGEETASQRLLVPESVELDPPSAAAVRQHARALEVLGLGLAPLGGNTFMVDAVPASVETQHVAAFVRDVAADLAAGGGSARRGGGEDERLAEILARRTALLREDLSPVEVERLLNDLHACHLPYTCPGGRPTMILISRDELKRKFGL